MNKRYFYIQEVTADFLKNVYPVVLEKVDEHAKEMLIRDISDTERWKPVGDTFNKELVYGKTMNEHGDVYEIPGHMCDPGRDDCYLYRYVYTMEAMEKNGWQPSLDLTGTLVQEKTQQQRLW